LKVKKMLEYTIGDNPNFAAIKEEFRSLAAAKAKELSDSDLLMQISALCETVEVYNAELIRRHQVLAAPSGRA